MKIQIVSMGMLLSLAIVGACDSGSENSSADPMDSGAAEGGKNDEPGESAGGGTVETSWTFATSQSAEAFHETMTNSEDGILLSSWPLTGYSVRIEDDGAFSRFHDEEAVRPYVIDVVEAICLDQGRDPEVCESAVSELQDAYIQVDSFGSIAARYRLAVLFFAVAEDNWFSFDRVLEKTEFYFDELDGYRALFLFKGFEPGGVIDESVIGLGDLAVVLDENEETLTLWSAQLSD